MSGSRWSHRGVNYFAEPEIGYWNCGSVTYEYQLCSGLHFIGNRNRQPGSTLTNPKFSDRCSSCNVTPHFFIVPAIGQSHKHLKTKKGRTVSPIPENYAFLAVAQCQKLFLPLQSLLLFLESF